MGTKKKFISTRTTLILILVLAIIGLGYIVISNLPPSIDYVTPKDVISNPVRYVNNNTIVKGYLDKNNENLPIITNTMDTTTVRDELRVDYSTISNRDNLREGSIYYFTGILEEKTEIDGVPLPVPIYIFNAEEFKAV